MEIQESNLSLLSFKLVYKIMLIAGLIVVCVTAILNYLFIQKLSEPRIQQVKDMANTTSVVVSELALASFYNNDKDRLNLALHNSVSSLNSSGKGFLQVSVILYPSGVYYASSNPEFVNKKVGQSLLKKIESNAGNRTSAEKLNYEFNNKSIPVLHFLKNIVIQENGEQKRIAVAQILFDYGQIIGKTRQILIIAAATFLVIMLIFIWVMYWPVTNLHKRIIKGFAQISNKNFDYRLRTTDQGEIGILFDAFNKMAFQLKNYFQERQQSKMNSAMSSIDSIEGVSRDLALRKTEITCLCARIPDIQRLVEDKSAETVADSITRFVEPFESIVKEYGGQVIKILGDKTYVLFEGINSIDNAIRTALKTTQKWQTINHERKVLNRPKLDFGIGLHSAEGVAGTLSHHSVSYTVVGKAASIAEYLCACSKPESILVSSSLMDKASGSFQHQVVEDIEPIGLGKDEQILLISNLHFSNESATSLAVNGLKETNGSGIGDMVSDMSGLASATNTPESSIPDMLEETLSNAPLDPVTPPLQKKKTSKDHSQLKDKEDEKAQKQSLWDQFEK